MNRLSAAVTSADAAVQLHEAEAKSKKVVKTASDQFALAALGNPRRYSTPFSEVVLFRSEGTKGCRRRWEVSLGQ